MPELPEVETVCRKLRPVVCGRSIAQIEVPQHYTKALVNPELAHLFSDQLVERVSRRAKFVVWHCAHGIIAFHLRMTGRLLTEVPDKIQYVTATIAFSDGASVWFHDVRKFGRVYLYSSFEDFENSHRLGIEPLSEDFTYKLLRDLCRASARQIKPFLLDQTKISGLGNIYVDECLWKSRIHPQTSTSSVPDSKLRVLYDAIQETLSESIAFHGTTFLSFYMDGNQAGGYRDQLKVFGRTGEPCLRCGAKIRKSRVAQRGTHLCPSCQR
jgi:formamidopyrimidine-DNA glycosylase